MAFTKKIIYQLICMTKYILFVWSSFNPQCVPRYTGQAILVRKVIIHAYSMYVLLADKVSCPMTQHFDSSDSQISNPWIPSLTLYELSHCAFKVHYLCKYDVVGGRALFLACVKPKSNIFDTVRALAKC